MGSSHSLGIISLVGLVLQKSRSKWEIVLAEILKPVVLNYFCCGFGLGFGFSLSTRIRVRVLVVDPDSAAGGFGSGFGFSLSTRIRVRAGAGV